MTEASLQVVGYVFLIEDDPNQEYTSARKIYAPIAYGSKSYNPSQIKTPTYAKEVLTIFLAFKQFGDKLRGATKLVIIMNVSKLVTRFFQRKSIPPP